MKDHERREREALEAICFDLGGYGAENQEQFLRGDFSCAAPEDVEHIQEVLTYTQCPYWKQDGSMGLYGPNTCMGGCTDEPRCSV